MPPTVPAHALAGEGTRVAGPNGRSLSTGAVGAGVDDSVRGQGSVVGRLGTALWISARDHGSVHASLRPLTAQPVDKNLPTRLGSKFMPSGPSPAGRRTPQVSPTGQADRLTAQDAAPLPNDHRRSRFRWLPALRHRHDREIVRLALPAFAALIAEPLFLLTDSAIIGHLG